MTQEQEERMLMLLERIAQNQKTMRQLMSKWVFYMERAESEVPERIRRYTNYMHDIHDITYMYEERGLPVPQHQLREMERCDDRFRQLLKEEHEGGTFDKVRREMAKDEENRWDHAKQLTFHGYRHKENSHGKPPVAKEQERPTGRQTGTDRPRDER